MFDTNYNNPFSEGDEIIHPSYGKGKVTYAGMNSNTVSVLFENDGETKVYKAERLKEVIIGHVHKSCYVKEKEKQEIVLIPTDGWQESKKPDRETAISKEDQLNLIIALETAKSLEEFLELV